MAEDLLPQRPRVGDGSVATLVMIDNFLIDVATSEEHVYESDVTDYPVESGSNVTDNIRPKGVQVTLNCIVSNTPFGQVATQRDAQPPADECYEHLRQLIKNRSLVTIRTSLKTFNNMALKSLSIPRKSGGGDYLEFTVVFVHVVLVKNVRTTPVSTPLAIPGHSVGASPIPSKRFIVLQGFVSDDGSFLWYDNDIEGYRRGAYPPTAISEFAGGLGNVAAIAALNPDSHKWSLSKGRPAGYSHADWPLFNFVPDAVVKARLKAVFKGNGNLPDGASQRDVQMVDARLLSTKPVL